MFSVNIIRDSATGQICQNPVSVNCGSNPVHVFELSAILQWIECENTGVHWMKHENTCPLDGKKITTLTRPKLEGEMASEFNFKDIPATFKTPSTIHQERTELYDFFNYQISSQNLPVSHLGDISSPQVLVPSEKNLELSPYPDLFAYFVHDGGNWDSNPGAISKKLLFSDISGHNKLTRFSICKHKDAPAYLALYFKKNYYRAHRKSLRTHGIPRANQDASCKNGELCCISKTPGELKVLFQLIRLQTIVDLREAKGALNEDKILRILGSVPKRGI